MNRAGHTAPALFLTKATPSSRMIFYNDQSDQTPPKGPVTRIVLRPNRSLSPVGFAWFLLIVWSFLMFPLLALVGMTALWVMLPFMLAVLLALRLSFHRSYRDGELFEELTLSPDLLKVHRHNPRKSDQSWQANPYWTKLAIREEGGPVENYITLKGSGREIELGAFLSPEERVELHKVLQIAIAKVKNPITT